MPGKKNREQKRVGAARKKTSHSPVPVWRSVKGVWLVLVLIVTCIALSPVLQNEFISLDDQALILENPIVQDGLIGEAFERHAYSPHYKPLVYLSWIVESKLFGFNPVVFHFNNLLIHLFNTLLVLFIALRIANILEVTRKQAFLIACLTALFFGIHPLHVESVAWAAERKDMLFSLFFLGGTLAYLRFLQEGNRMKWIWIGASCYLLSLLSKSMGITLLGVLFLLDYVSGRQFHIKRIVEKLPFFVVFLLGTLFYGILYHPKESTSLDTVQELTQSLPATLENLPSLYQWVVIASYRVVLFFVHHFVPTHLTVVYPREYLLEIAGGALHLSPLLVLGILAAPFLFKHKRRMVLAGILFFMLTIAPVLLKEGIGTNFISDRYTYIPSIGLIFLIVSLVLTAFPKPVFKHLSPGVIVLGATALWFTFLTYSQARVWHSGLSLWEQAIENYPENWMGYHNRGKALMDEDPGKALADFNRAIELMPYHRVYYSRGTLYLNSGDKQGAIEDFTSCLRDDPRNERALVNRGNAYRDLGQFQLALADYNAALALEEDFVKALNNRSVTYLRAGDPAKALEDVNRVIELDPQYINAYLNRAAIYLDNQVGQFDNAIREYDTVLKMDPQNHQAYYWRGWCKAKLGRPGESLMDYDQAVALSPGTGYYYVGRSYAKRALGQNGGALEDAQKAIQLGARVDPSYLAALRGG